MGVWTAQWFATRLTQYPAFKHRREVCDRVLWSPVLTHGLSPVSSHFNGHIMQLRAPSRMISIRSVTCFIMKVKYSLFFYSDTALVASV